MQGLEDGEGVGEGSGDYDSMDYLGMAQDPHAPNEPVGNNYILYMVGK
jgi:hypothetical protein